MTHRVTHVVFHIPSRFLKRCVLGCVADYNRCVYSAMSTISGDDQEFVEIREGKAKILFPKENDVFYNPVQQLNRDLSIAVIKYYSQHCWNPASVRKKKGSYAKKPPVAISAEGQKDEQEHVSDVNMSEPVDTCTPSEGSKHCDLSLPVSAQKPQGLYILEALAASGLRSIRYALEIPAIDSIVANDFSNQAYESICRNIRENGVDHLISPSCREASMLMYEHRDLPNKWFDVVDVDPYGSPSKFLDATVQACADGGLLCITCTDTAVLCGNNSETSFTKYGSVSLKTKYCHEMALRIVLASLESHANRYRRYIVPLLSCSLDFYVRIFVKLCSGQSQAKKSASKQSMVYHCVGCGSYHLQPLGNRSIADNGQVKYSAGNGPPVDRKCDQCGSGFKVGGPIWSESIHDVEFVQGLQKMVSNDKGSYHTSERILGHLAVISEELPDVPLFYELDEICSTLHCNSMKMLIIRSALLNQGYRVSIFHGQPKAIKTDAPHHVLWDIMRCWIKMNPVKNIKPNSPGAAILSQEPKIDVSFQFRDDANPPSRKSKLARFPYNPEPNWGPKSRAKRRHNVEDQEKTQTKLQKHE